MTTNIAPWLYVRRGADAVRFYKSAFGAVEVHHVEAPDGAVVSRLSIDGAEFWTSDESPDHGSVNPTSIGKTSVRLILTVSDPEVTFARALAAGATEVYPITESHGWKTGLLTDPFSHQWEIGRPIA